MIFLCYSAPTTFILCNGVLVKFSDNIPRGQRFLRSLYASATLLTPGERRLAHYAPIGRSLRWQMRTQQTYRREASLQHFGTVVNNEAAI